MISIQNSFLAPLGALALCLPLLTGCGGGSSSGSSGGGGTTTSTDMGSLATVSTSYRYTIKSAVSSLDLGIDSASQTAGAKIVQKSDTTAGDTAWHFIPMASGEYNVENMLTHQVMGISAASTASGAQVLQWADNGTNDHLWAFYLLTDGNYLIKNMNSGLYLQVANSDTSSTATIDQGERSSSSTGCTCQEWSLSKSTTAAYPAPRTVTGTGTSVHDPMMIQDPATHHYWLLGTHQTVAVSKDLSTFTDTTMSSAEGACTTSEGGAWLTTLSYCPLIGPDFASWSGLQTPLSYNNGQSTDVWAPSELYANGTYYLYYSIPYEPSTGAEAVIGLATGSTPYGPWTDKGYVVSSWTAATTTPPTTNPWGFSASTTWNSIDPAPFVDNDGNWWLVFGSWQDGTHLIQLDPKTGLRLDAKSYSVAVRAAGEEGPYIYYWKGYYYYFAPINVCCSGTSSTYRTIVGRSKTVTGPYLDRGGLDLTNGGGTILVSTHDNIYGPGGGSVFTDTGADGSTALPTFVYHYYDGNNNGAPTLGINRLVFDADGWPSIQ